MCAGERTGVAVLQGASLRSADCVLFFRLHRGNSDQYHSDLKANDEVKCTVVKVIEQGVKLNVEGASAFLPNNNFGEKTEFAEGEEFTAKVRVFDAEKHRLIVTLKVEAPKVKHPKKQNNDKEVKYISQDKVSNTLGDLINFKDFE